MRSQALARKHFKTRFIKCDVERVPFLVERLNVKVLPCVVFFVDGISKDRFVSFLCPVLQLWSR